MKKGVYHTNDFIRPIEEVIRDVNKSIPNCNHCLFNKNCGPGCTWKEIRYYLMESKTVLQEIESGKRCFSYKDCPWQEPYQNHVQIFQDIMEKLNDKVQRKENGD